MPARKRQQLHKPVRPNSKTKDLLQAIVEEPGIKVSVWAKDNWDLRAAQTAVFRLRLRGLVKPPELGPEYGRAYPTYTGTQFIQDHG